MTFYFCRLVTEEENIFSLRKLLYEIKSCLTVEFPKRFFCLPNKASVLYRQWKRRKKKKKAWPKLVGKEMEKVECWANSVKRSQA